MIEAWILKKLEPLKGDPLIILRDPQRMILAGARAVDGWAEENSYTVLFCAGNMALREMIDAVRDDPQARILLVDRSRETAKIPLFYPDLIAKTDARHRLYLSLREFLVEQTSDVHWPVAVNERNISRLLLEDLPGTLRAYKNLRQVSDSRFTDSDLDRIALGVKLDINPFLNPSINEVRRLCVEQHRELDELNRVLPDEVMESLRQAIAKVPKPFCWLLDRDPEPIIRAFTLAAIMRQHGLDYKLLLSNLDTGLSDYRDIDPKFLDSAMRDQLTSDPDRVLADVADAERFLREKPVDRLAFLLHDQMDLDDPAQALEVLRSERLSVLIRSLALVSLLADLIEIGLPKFHRQVIELLDEQAAATDLPVLRRPTDEWQSLEATYRRAFEVFELTGKLAGHTRTLQVQPVDELEFDTFDKLWNQDCLNRLDYYLSDLGRSLRLGHMLPVSLQDLWPELRTRWENARAEFKSTAAAVSQAQNLIDRRFQDLYRKRYSTWIHESDSPVIFTHQFLPRLLKAHWDPQSGQKAIILVFDGLRTDAWDEFLRPIFEERYDLIDSRPGSAILPTETQLSRKAISAGTMPTQFTSQRESDLLQDWLKQNMGLTLRFEVIKDDDTVASGMTLRYVSDKLEYIVFNFTDKNLHNNNQELALIYGTTVSTIIREDVRSVLRELPEDALLFITSDHGFAPVPSRTVSVPSGAVVDNHDIKYRNARTTSKLTTQDKERVIDFDVRRMDIPNNSPTLKGQTFDYVLFPRPGFTLRRPHGHRNPDPYTHGGLSLAECLVPMVVMGPRLKIRPWLIIEDLRQVGSVSESGELTLEVVVKASKSGLLLNLSFSLPVIPDRKEVSTSGKHSYTVRWTPGLDAVTDEDRKRGEVVMPVTAVLTYQQEGETVRVNRSTDVRIKLDPTRIHRRLDSKLDFLMGKVPKTLK